MPTKTKSSNIARVIAATRPMAAVQRRARHRRGNISPVSPDYTSPYAFPDKIQSVTIAVQN